MATSTNWNSVPIDLPSTEAEFESNFEQGKIFEQLFYGKIGYGSQRDRTGLIVMIQQAIKNGLEIEQAILAQPKKLSNKILHALIQ